MVRNAVAYPEWIVQQRGVRYRTAGWKELGGSGWHNRSTLIRRYARHLQEVGREVTLTAIRDMLRFVDRGYVLNADQISRALAPLYEKGIMKRAPNGSPVRIGDRVYPSARAAAEALDISPQTVLNRIASEKEKWKDWVRAE